MGKRPLWQLLPFTAKCGPTVSCDLREGGWIRSRRGRGEVLRRVTLARHFASQVKLGILLLATPSSPLPTPPRVGSGGQVRVRFLGDPSSITCPMHCHAFPLLIAIIALACCSRPAAARELSISSVERGASGKWQVATWAKWEKQQQQQQQCDALIF